MYRKLHEHEAPPEEDKMTEEVFVERMKTDLDIFVVETRREREAGTKGFTGTCTYELWLSNFIAFRIGFSESNAAIVH